MIHLLCTEALDASYCRTVDKSTRVAWQRRWRIRHDSLTHTTATISFVVESSINNDEFRSHELNSVEIEIESNCLRYIFGWWLLFLGRNSMMTNRWNELSLYWLQMVGWWRKIPFKPFVMELWALITSHVLSNSWIEKISITRNCQPCQISLFIFIEISVYCYRCNRIKISIFACRLSTRLSHGARALSTHKWSSYKLRINWNISTLIWWLIKYIQFYWAPNLTPNENQP